jgi:hypothetical protein
MPDRGVSPVVGKLLEIGVVLLFATTLTVALSGGVVPDARSAAGEELADRVLASAATSVVETVPAAGQNASVTRRLALPDSIAGEPYRLRTAGRTLVLEHPVDRLSARHRLALPSRVVAVRGSVASGEPALVRVTSTAEGLVVEVRPA